MRGFNFHTQCNAFTDLFQAYIINLPVGLDSYGAEKDVVRVNGKKWTTTQKSRWNKVVLVDEI